MHRRWHIALLYALFAVMATSANLLAQGVCVAFYRGPYHVEGAMLAGTALGLPVKYLLDKRYIFNFSARNLAHDGQLFTLYTLTGLFTTALFWGTEMLFHRLFGRDGMRYLGGVLGLSLGYLLKYQLDKRHVFEQRVADPVPHA